MPSPYRSAYAFSTRCVRGRLRRHYFYGQSADPDTEITLTNGAAEALHSIAAGLINPGDEVYKYIFLQISGHRSGGGHNPPSAFYSAQNKSLGQPHIRFAFCKTMETLECASEKLLKIKI